MKQKYRPIWIGSLFFCSWWMAPICLLDVACRCKFKPVCELHSSVLLWHLNRAYPD